MAEPKCYNPTYDVRILYHAKHEEVPFTAKT